MSRWFYDYEVPENLHELPPEEQAKWDPKYQYNPGYEKYVKEYDPDSYVNPWLALDPETNEPIVDPNPEIEGLLIPKEENRYFNKTPRIIHPKFDAMPDDDKKDYLRILNYDPIIELGRSESRKAFEKVNKDRFESDEELQKALDILDDIREYEIIESMSICKAIYKDGMQKIDTTKCSRKLSPEEKKLLEKLEDWSRRDPETGLYIITHENLVILPGGTMCIESLVGKTFEEAGMALEDRTSGTYGFPIRDNKPDPNFIPYNMRPDYIRRFQFQDQYPHEWYLQNWEEKAKKDTTGKYPETDIPVEIIAKNVMSKHYILPEGSEASDWDPRRAKSFEGYNFLAYEQLDEYYQYQYDQWTKKINDNERRLKLLQEEWDRLLTLPKEDIIMSVQDEIKRIKYYLHKLPTDKAVERVLESIWAVIKQVQIQLEYENWHRTYITVDKDFNDLWLTDPNKCGKKDKKIKGCFTMEDIVNQEMEFVKEYIAYEEELKEVKVRFKSKKEEFIARGVNVKAVMKSIKKISKSFKLSPSDKEDIERIENDIRSNSEIMDYLQSVFIN